MNGSILSLATAVPPYAVAQTVALKKYCEFFQYEGAQLEQIRKLYENSGIEKRHVVTDDFLKAPEDRTFLSFDYPKTVPGMTSRNDLYKKEAAGLALQAAEKAIEEWGGDLAAITHIISVSCTGVVIPGIEFSLMMALKLNPSIFRLGINFMGCFGAFKGLEVAHALAKENPRNRILIVCTELCSLHIQADGSLDSLVANSIFADGAAAAIVGCAPQANEKPLWDIVKHQSIGLKDSEQQMRWEAGDHGFSMKLSSHVPISISRHIRSFADGLLGTHTSIADCDWPIHPGGKAIVQTIEKKLMLLPSQTEASWHTLANFGNMSSATFLFVLDKLRHQKQQKPWSAGVGFGPGLSMEGLLLKTP